MTDSDFVTPRMNSSTLGPSMADKNVRFVGRVGSVSGHEVSLQSSNGDTVRAVLKAPASFPSGTHLEIIGTYLASGSIKASHITDFGPSFNLANWKRKTKSPLPATSDRSFGPTPTASVFGAGVLGVISALLAS